MSIRNKCVLSLIVSFAVATAICSPAHAQKAEEPQSESLGLAEKYGQIAPFPKDLEKFRPFHLAFREICLKRLIRSNSNETPSTEVIQQIADYMQTQTGVRFQAPYYKNYSGTSLVVLEVENPTSTTKDWTGLNLVWGNGQIYFSIVDKSIDESLLKASYWDSNCALSYAKVAILDSHRKMVERRWQNPLGDVYQRVFVKQNVKSLEEIYTTRAELNKAKEVRKAATVLTTVMDTGVDYNHPELADRMDRPNYRAAKLWTGINLNFNAEIAPFSSMESLLLALTEPGRTGKRKKEEQHLKQILENRIERSLHVGLDFEHKDNLPYDYKWDLNAEATDRFFHGTHVAGIIAGAPEAAILPVRIGHAKNTDLEKAIDYSSLRGSKLVNISMGTTSQVQWAYFEIGARKHPEMLFVVAAGNEKVDIDTTLMYPASFSLPNKIVVASVDKNGIFSSSFSNWGKKTVDVAALGHLVDSTKPGNQRDILSGTSMATPMVTRLAARIMAMRPDLSPGDIRQIICLSVHKTTELETRTRCGGYIDDAAALSLAVRFGKT